ncbi:MAG: hypothetical protein ACRD0K_10995 [Egibacteraceae bacterium]
MRIEATEGEIARLRAELDAWVRHREGRDPTGQYVTQRLTLREVVVRTLARIEADVDAIDPGRPTDEVYERCRADDERAVFVRRYWSWFRSKFDQRDEPIVGDVLRAADEVVWSCYAEVFRSADLPLGPAPLAYIEPRFSAEATPRITPPRDLKQGDELLGRHIAQLPIPVIALPPMCIDRPWWLVLLAHETGHHVQYDLGDGLLIDTFGPALARLARETGRVDEDGSARWQGWDREVFADVFSVLTAGPWAGWAIIELETGAPQRLVRRDNLYPPPLVRTALMAALASELGVAGPAEAILPGLDELDVAEPAATRAAADLAAVPSLASALLKERFAGLAPLDHLCGWRSGYFAPGGRVEGWRDDLLATSEPPVSSRLESARLCVAGGVAAWQRIANATSDRAERAERREWLAQRLRRALPRCREPGTRAAELIAVPAVDRLARDLSEDLFAHTVS